jgi:hypothetical protein
MLAPAFWLLTKIMGDTYWLHFYYPGSISQCLLWNGILSGLQFILGSILICRSSPSVHFPVFALGSVITDLLARFLLHQSFLTVTSLGLVVAGTCCLAGIFPVSSPSKRNSRTPKLVILGIGIGFLLNILIFGIYFLARDQQPILTLMDQASLRFHDYSTSVKALNLRAAVNEYNHRYGRPPPPGFDIWFQFATDRGVKVIHDYDQVVEDLRPFWGIEPAVLRERVVHVASNEWNQVGLIRIRNKKAEVEVAPQWRVFSFRGLPY